MKKIRIECRKKTGEVSPLRQASPATSPKGEAMDGETAAGVCPVCGEKLVDVTDSEGHKIGWYCGTCGYDGEDCRVCRRLKTHVDFLSLRSGDRFQVHFCPNCGKRVDIK